MVRFWKTVYVLVVVAIGSATLWGIFHGIGNGLG